MGKPKQQQQHQQKPKPKKNPIVKKKQGKHEDITQFRAQLDALGLKIIQLTADGNCFFRGLADQLEGNEEQHGKYRALVVEYIVKNKEMFEPFIEDDIPFDEYCKSMENDGTWAGHMELQAASLVTRSNICIHRYISPRWYIQNFNQPGARMIHLSYHDEEHYNSVRSKEDPCDGPARPITIKADADLPAASHQAKTMSGKSKGQTSWDDIDTGSIKLVMAGTGCDNAEKVKKVLQEVDGDVDVAIEFLVAEQEADDYSAENDSVPCLAETSYGQHDKEDGRYEQQKEEPLKNAKKNASSSFSGTKQTRDNSNSPADDKKISRNQACPCGSKKKYKACCGTIKGKSKFAVTVDSKKSRKETKQKKKGQSAESAGPCGSDVGPPDLGALCI